MSITGSLDTMPLPDLVQFLGLGRKTGVLRVEGPGGRKRLVFDGGIAVYCAGDHPKEYLGQHLLARTDLTEADLETAFRLQKQSGQKLGEVLVGNGFLTAEELDRVLRHKIEDSMFELFTWGAGTFAFEEGALDGEDIPVRVRMPWADLVMEGARRADEMAVIRKILPGPHVTLRVHREAFKAGFPRTGGDRRLVELAEGGLCIGDILPRFHTSDFDILTRIAGLVHDGAFEPIGARDVPTASAAAPAAMPSAAPAAMPSAAPAAMPSAPPVAMPVAPPARTTGGSPGAASGAIASPAAGTAPSNGAVDPRRAPADAVVRRASLLLHAERAPEAYVLLREAARVHFDDPAIADALADCEAKLRRRYSQMFPDRSVALSLRVSLEQLAQDQSLSSKEGFLASRMNGTWPLSSVLQLCPFDELEALCLVESLLQRGVVEMRLPVRA